MEQQIFDRRTSDCSFDHTKLTITWLTPISTFTLVQASSISVQHHHSRISRWKLTVCTTNFYSLALALVDAWNAICMAWDSLGRRMLANIGWIYVLIQDGNPLHHKLKSRQESQKHETSFMVTRAGLRSTFTASTQIAFNFRFSFSTFLYP